MEKRKYEPVDIVAVPVEQYLYDLNQQVYEIKQSLQTLLNIIIDEKEKEVDTRTEKEKMCNVIGGIPIE